MTLPKLLDCTLRDGGYINDWQFSRQFGSALYSAASESGCDYVEAGFIDPDAKSGLPWTNLAASDLLELRAAAPEGCKIAVMINYGSLDLKDVPPADAYPADMIRVATPQSTAKEATELAAAISELGYETTVNYMGISNYLNDEIIHLLDLMNAYKNQVSYFYVADSFGSLIPRRTREIFTALRFGTDAKLGFHPHNNLQLAFANCLEAMEAGVDIIDGSMFGMGRGAGNLFTDAMLAYYEQRSPERYQLVPVLQFADLYMEQLKETHAWGYSLPQLLSGVFHCHPNYPTNLLRQKSYTADDIYLMLRHLPEAEKARFSTNQLDEIKSHHLKHLAEQVTFSPSRSIQSLCQKTGEHALLICGGRSVLESKGIIDKLIERESPSVFSVNNPEPPVPCDGVFYGNRRRLLQHFDKTDAESEVIFGVGIHAGAEKDFAISNASRVNSLAMIPEGESPFPMVLPTNSAIEAILGLVQLGYRKISICGLDGYSAGEPSHYYSERDAISLPDEQESQNLIIQSELKAAAALAEKLGFSFEIITPTLFKDHSAI